MSPYVGLTFDIIMLFAFGITMWRAIVLSRQFEKIQADRKAFELLIQALNLAAAKAEGAIRSLKDAAIESGGALQDKVNKARGLSDELEIMVQAGDNLAERLQDLAGKSHRGGSHIPDNEDNLRADPAQKAGMQPRTRAEKELVDALKAKQKS